VQEVVGGGPAASAKLKAGDIIISVGDTAVSKASDLQRLMVEAQIGSPLALTVLRGDHAMELGVTPVELT